MTVVPPTNSIRERYHRKGRTSNWRGEGENGDTEADDRSRIRLFHHCSRTGSAELAIQIKVRGEFPGFVSP